MNHPVPYSALPVNAVPDVIRRPGCAPLPWTSNKEKETPNPAAQSCVNTRLSVCARRKEGMGWGGGGRDITVQGKPDSHV